MNDLVKDGKEQGKDERMGRVKVVKGAPCEQSEWVLMMLGWYEVRGGRWLGGLVGGWCGLAGGRWV